MSLQRQYSLIAFCALAISGAANASEPATPPIFNRVVECRSIADAEQRLACYDTRTYELQAAAARQEVMIVDREQVRRTRRTLFGLSLPNLGIFGDGEEGDEGVSRLETTITGVRTTPDGKWVLSLKEGGTWEQTDSRNLIVDPEVGAPIVIRRAAFGSYLANVQGQLAIRVKRIR